MFKRSEMIELARNDTRARKTVERLVRRARRRGVLFEEIADKGAEDPIAVTFRSRYQFPGRYLMIWPDGSITQRCDSTENGYYDPNAEACYDRWFWREMKSVAFWRTRGEYRMARRVLANARRFRKLAEFYAADLREAA